LVDERSACIDGYTKTGLDASHTMMNKFSGPHDGNFELVSNAIVNLVRESTKILADRQGESIHNLLMFRSSKGFNVRLLMMLIHSEADSTSVFIVPFPRNKDFVQRGHILDDLNRLLPIQQQGEIAALVGSGGVG
jgi:hypothetical protein